MQKNAAPIKRVQRVLSKSVSAFSFIKHSMIKGSTFSYLGFGSSFW